MAHNVYLLRFNSIFSGDNLKIALHNYFYALMTIISGELV